MPGREDFAIIRARALTDSRVLRAAEMYVERRIARADTAVAAVLGHIALIALWTSRETSDGRLPGDGLGVVRVATASSQRTSRVILDVLMSPEVDLITRDSDGIRQRGFSEAYAPIIEKRAADAERKRKSRGRPADVSGTSNRTSAWTSERTGPTGPDRTEEHTPLPPADAGGCSASPSQDAGGTNGHPGTNGRAKATASDVAAMDAVLTRQAAFFGPVSAQSQSSKDAQELRKRLRAGDVPATEVIRFLALHDATFHETIRAARDGVRREARAARNGGKPPTLDEGTENGDADGR